jgi:subtilisin family serine protease
MPRYILVNRRAGKFSAEAKHASRAQVATALARIEGSAKIVADKNPADDLARRVVVFDADPAAVAKLQATLSPDAILEPLIRRSLHRRVLPMGFTNVSPLPEAASASTQYHVTITAGGQPLAGIQVMFYFRGPGGTLKDRTVNTDNQGVAAVRVPQGSTVAMVEPIPESGFWIMLVDAPPSGSTIECTAIAKSHAGGAGWWHEAMGVDVNNANRGQGIKVGVIDTGCGPHPNLAHVNLVGTFIDGQVLPGNQATDVAQHGTHTSGIIGARPTRPGDYAGMATGCDLFHARVFKGEDEGPTQADLINAIDSLSRGHGCDLINMSLGGGPPSEAEEDCIRDASERGTLCVCSAGNEDAAIDFPGAYPECAAVSAIGLLGWAPAGTFSASNRPQEHSKMGQNNLFLAAFSCFGPTLACAAPGVGIVSTVPSNGSGADLYMEMDGTSMASPAACGVLADILSQDGHYNSLPRDASRTAAARNLLAQHCLPFGLPVKFEGRGLPEV